MPENFVWGGIETYLKQMLPLLAKNDAYDITAVVTQDSQLYHALRDAGVKVFGIPFPLRKKSLLRSMWVNPWMRLIDLSVYVRLFPILKRIQPDLVHIHNGRLEQSLIGLAGFPIVYTYHGYGGPFNLEGSPNQWARMLYTLARPLFSGLIPFLSGMTVVSAYEKQRLYRERFLPANFQADVVHNALPCEEMLNTVTAVNRDAMRRELGVPQEQLESARVVSFACRLRQDRNPLAFLRVAKAVLSDPRRKNPVYFIAAGEGKLAGEFEAAFQNDPLLSRHGKFLGFRNDMPSIIKASDMTVNFSMQEGFGLRVLESLLFGKPCITYAAGGIPEVMSLPQAEDWLVTPGDETEFIEQLIQAINLPQEALRQLGSILQTHAQTFDLATHMQALDAFYARVAAKKHLHLSTKNSQQATAGDIPAIKDRQSMAVCAL